MARKFKHLYHKALLGFISDKLTIPVAELSKDRISDALKEGSVPQEYINTFIGILDACEFARYVSYYISIL